MSSSRCSCCGQEHHQAPSIRIIGAVPRESKNKRAVEKAFAPVHEAIQKFREEAAQRAAFAGREEP